MSKPFAPPDPLETLMAAALVIGAFRHGLQRSGYPFREPPDVAAVLRDIDSLCYPSEVARQRVARAS